MESRRAIWSRAPAIAAPATRPRMCLAPTSAAARSAAALVHGWFAPRLDAAARSGLKSWSVDDIVEYLQSGRNGRSHAGGPMAEVVVNSTSKMSDADVHAIAVYLKDLPAGRAGARMSRRRRQAQMADGARIYKHACIACHEADGSGAPRIYPPLPGNANLQSADPRKHAAHHSRRRADRDHAARAQPRIDAGLCQRLSDQEIADVATYIRNSWGNSASAVTAEQVERARK